MPNLATENLYSLERELVSLFGRFTGADTIDIVKVTVKNGTSTFTVGELVTAVGGAGGTGTVYSKGAETGTWDAPTHTGVVVLDIVVVSGSFSANDTLTGSVSGAGEQNGAAAADSIFPAMGSGAGLAIKEVAVDGGSVRFAIGEEIEDGVAPARGIIKDIYAVGGVWDATTHTGTAILVVKVTAGTWANDNPVIGNRGGAATVNGTPVSNFFYVKTGTVLGKGVASISNDITNAGTAGLLTLTLSDKWAGLLQFEECVIDANSPDDWAVVVVSEAVATSKTIVLQCFKGGVAAHPTSDEKVLFEIVLSNGAGALHGY